VLSADSVSVTLDDTPIVRDVSFALPPGTWTGLLGPNGSGKTTLLRALGGHVPFEGAITLDGQPLQAWTARECAQQLAFVRQAPSLTFDFTVRELVALGRSPHTGWFGGPARSAHDAIHDALQAVDLEGFADRSVLSLSGGERQRAFLAQALVQDTPLLLLDEPTAHLDVRYQFRFLDRVRSLVSDGRTVLAVFHDLEQAARYAERLLLLRDGRLVADGPPVEVLTPRRIGAVFQMDADVRSDPQGDLRIHYRAAR
jgi:iron complex transport system ATP-binding protein